MGFVLMHPTGNANVRAILRGMLDQNLLAEFNTTIAVSPSNSFLKFIPAKFREELLRRSFDAPNNKIHLHPFREAARQILPKLGFSSITKHEVGWASLDAIYQSFDAAVAKRLPSLKKKYNIYGVYAFEDGALETFRSAKVLGIKCIYDLPIAYWETGRKLMQEEAQRLPEWAITLAGGIQDSDKKLERKTQEMEHADVVVGPGDFVLNSLPEWARSKQLIMSPFGSPVTAYSDNDKNERRADQPLRILFVGSMGQRKGLGDLFNAIKQLKRKDVELVVLGSLLAPMDFYRTQLSDFVYESSRPHEQVLQLMRSCDVFCLPSIVEGRALVMQEAMSQGLPLIITPNTGGADLVVEGETGFLIPIRSPIAIAEKIAWFADNRDNLPAMGEKARKHAAHYTWANYASRVIQGITS